TPVKRPAYPLRVPAAGDYYELLNSDTKDYGGQTEKSQLLKSVKENSHEDGPYLIYIDLAPLSTIYLKKKEDGQGKKQDKYQQEY
ncbi:MAG: alpha amylase C-terminal domain-containing protein, partial [Caldicoprobacterales bacterium]